MVCFRDCKLNCVTSPSPWPEAPQAFVASLTQRAVSFIPIKNQEVSHSPLPNSQNSSSLLHLPLIRLVWSLPACPRNLCETTICHSLYKLVCSMFWAILLGMIVAQHASAMLPQTGAIWAWHRNLGLLRQSNTF